MKYKVMGGGPMTDEKASLLTMIVTEGYTDASSFGFTNTQELLHANFSGLVEKVYGNVNIGRNKLTSRVSSIAIAKDLSNLLPDKTFRDDVLDFILSSQSTLRNVLRIVADTQGSLLVSIKRASKNFTVECRIVLASSNPAFSSQIGIMLSALRIGNNVTKYGVVIGKKSEISRFIGTVGFSQGVKVVRKKAGESLWFGCEKATLQRLFFRISKEQERARDSGFRGAFADCLTREQTLRRLKTWYAEVSGGGVI